MAAWNRFRWSHSGVRRSGLCGTTASNVSRFPTSASPRHYSKRTREVKHGHTFDDFAFPTLSPGFNGFRSLPYPNHVLLDDQLAMSSYLPPSRQWVQCGFTAVRFPPIVTVKYFSVHPFPLPLQVVLVSLDEVTDHSCRHMSDSCCV